MFDKEVGAIYDVDPSYEISNTNPVDLIDMRMYCCVSIFFGRVKSFHFCLTSSFSKEIKKKEDETPNEFVFLLRAFLLRALLGILGATCFGGQFGKC